MRHSKPVQREEVVASCVLPFSEMAFDRVTAIVAPDKTKSRADMEAWKDACGAHPLSGRNAPWRLSARKTERCLRRSVSPARRASFLPNEHCQLERHCD